MWLGVFPVDCVFTPPVEPEQSITNSRQISCYYHYLFISQDYVVPRLHGWMVAHVTAIKLNTQCLETLSLELFIWLSLEKFEANNELTLLTSVVCIQSLINLISLCHTSPINLYYEEQYDKQLCALSWLKLMLTSSVAMNINQITKCVLSHTWKYSRGQQTDYLLIE